MEAPLIVGIVFLSIVAVIKIISDTVVRNKLISNGLVDDRVKHLFGLPELNLLSNLKWGMVLVGVGIASLLSEVFPYYMETEGTIGLMLIFAGLAFLIYFAVAKSRVNKHKEQHISANG